MKPCAASFETILPFTHMTSTPILLKPGARVFNAVPYQEPTPPPVPTLRRVLYVKFLRWVEASTSRTLMKAFCKAATLSGIAAGVFAPQFTIGVLYGALQWRQYGLLKFAAVVIAVTYAATCIRWLRRTRIRRTGGSQNLYHGIPIDAMATYLLERQSFKRDDAMRHFGISQHKHQTISEELDKHQIVIRGENNSRVLNAITREQLVRQLRDKFPLQFHNGEWCERTDSFQRWIIEKDRSEAQEKEKAGRLERKVNRLQKKRGELETGISAFQRIVRPVTQ